MNGKHQPGSPPKTKITCALCGELLGDDKRSGEHVIPNALGGRKKVQNFICATCNSETGSDWDGILIQQLHPLCTMLDIKRDRGNNQPFQVKTLSGRELMIKPNGSMGISKPIFKKRKHDNKIEVKIQARTKNEARNMLLGLNKKYPQLDVAEAMKRTESVQEYSSEPYVVPFNVGGLIAGRSIVKSCLAMAYDAGLSISDCNEAKIFLSDEGEPCYGLYGHKSLVKNRPKNICYHCICVCGDAEKGQLLAYVEYFGWLKFIVCLSKNYEGCTFSHSYALNPISGEELEDLDIELSSDTVDVDEIFNQEKVDFREMKKDLDALIMEWREIDYCRALENIIEDTCKECGIEEGNILSDKQVEEFVEAFSRRLEPFLIHTIFGLIFTEEELSEIKRKN